MEDKAFSSIDFVGQCLIDKNRSLAFEKAIKKLIKKGSTVLDVGTGSGIMALFVARAGAKKVIGIEFDPFIASVAQKNINANKFQNVISIREKDARNCVYEEKEPFDAIVMEMLTTGMVDEFQVQAVNNLHDQKLIDQHTKLIPNKQDTYVTLGYLNYKRYNLNLPTIRHLWKFHNPADISFKPASKPVLLHSIDFSKKIDEVVQQRITFTALITTKINSIRLSSVTHLGEKLKIGDTDSINAPVSIPIDEIKVKKNETIIFEISYTFGHGYNSLKIHRIM